MLVCFCFCFLPTKKDVGISEAETSNVGMYEIVSFARLLVGQRLRRKTTLRAIFDCT